MRSELTYHAMVAGGIPHDLAVELDVNIGDIRTAAEEMDALLASLGRAKAVDLGAALLIESEAVDHLPQHIKALRKAAKALRRHAEQAEYPELPDR